MAAKLKGGGGKGVSGRATKKNFCSTCQFPKMAAHCKQQRHLYLYLVWTRWKFPAALSGLPAHNTDQLRFVQQTLLHLTVFFGLKLGKQQEKAGPLRKNNFFWSSKKKFRTKFALVVGPLKMNFFCGTGFGVPVNYDHSSMSKKACQL